jgi:hypothetical protein
VDRVERAIPFRMQPETQRVGNILIGDTGNISAGFQRYGRALANRSAPLSMFISLQSSAFLGL